MTPWNAEDEDVIAAASRYQQTRLDRGQGTLPVVYVPLHWRTGQWQPDTAEVQFHWRDRPRVVRRFNQPCGDSQT